ncbi:AAA family ATPase [Campylobacter sp. 2018MI35]|nr:AAA family ATPase [Campylobacter sp. 2018MI34]MBK1992221.1 AAA family ATPase [Campylobacter sp. 2018MI34]
MNINSISDYEEFLKKIYEKYRSKLLEFKKDEIESYKNNKEIKKLKTKENYNFYVARNSKSIVSFVDSSKELCDTFTIDNFLNKLKNIDDKQIRSYNPIIYKDILENNSLVSDSSDYFLVPSNPDNFSLEDYFNNNKDEDLRWGKSGGSALLNMKSNNKIFFYTSKESKICFYGVIKEVREDGEFIINKIQKLEKTIDLDEAKEYNFTHPQKNQNFSNLFILNYLLLANNLIFNKDQNIPLNQILYGPPGTGKTYHTIDKALEILGENIESRDEKKAKFDEYVKNGQIVFTTFHQSYGYEEFVEGIKPDLDKKNKNENSQINYKIKDGIFKELCQKALEALEQDFKKSKDSFLEYFKEEKKINLEGKEFRFEEPNNLCIKNLKIHLNYVRNIIEKIGYNKPQDIISFIQEIIQVKDNPENIIKHYEIIINYFYNEYFKIKKFIIIIDEINRGNVSKIFGELITLIEPSKRLGNKEALELTLPYSGEKFGVPKNVYIIGTMNTADRSITSLDTALRRRFEFVEMMPDVSELSIDCEGINLQELLIAINTRIEYLLDREKTIGHAFFIGVENLEGLKKVFQNKIIPLLQEYFYNDYALIDAVLNSNDMIDKKELENIKYLQKKTLDNVDSEGKIYKIASFDKSIWDKIKTYQAIYEK